MLHELSVATYLIEKKQGNVLLTVNVDLFIFKIMC